MADQPATAFEIHSEARGPHWVAWLTEPGHQGPFRSALIVGASKEEAESRAREWAAAQEGQRDRSSRPA